MRPSRRTRSCRPFPGVDDPHQHTEFRENLFRENFTCIRRRVRNTGSSQVSTSRAAGGIGGYKLLSRHAGARKEVRQLVNFHKVSACWSWTICCAERCAIDGIRLDPPRSPLTSRAAATPSRTCRRSCCERYNIQVEKSTFNTLPAADDRNHELQGFAPVRRAHAPRHARWRHARRWCRRRRPGFTRLRYLPRRRLLLRRGAGAVFERARAVNASSRGHLRRPDRAYQPASRLVPGSVTGTVVELSSASCCTRPSAPRCNGSCAEATAPASGVEAR